MSSRRLELAFATFARLRLRLQAAEELDTLVKARGTHTTVQQHQLEVLRESKEEAELELLTEWDSYFARQHREPTPIAKEMAQRTLEHIVKATKGGSR